MQTITNAKMPFPEWCASFKGREDFVVLDTETTDCGPKWDRGEVIDLAIVDHQGQVIYNKLIKPTVKIGDATAVHRITESDVDEAPTWAEEWPSIEELLQGKLILTYNARFDAARFEISAAAHRMELPTYKWSCLMEEYARFYGAPGRYGNPAWQKLTVACVQQGLSTVEAHRALADTQMAYALLMACGSGKALNTYSGTYTPKAQ